MPEELNYLIYDKGFKKGLSKRSDSLTAKPDFKEGIAYKANGIFLKY